MVLTPPSIDPRSQADVAAQLKALLVRYLQPYGWQAGHDGGEPGRALTGICAYYASQVIERVNRAPEKNFLAFLDLLGNSLTPPTPAEVPLTFFLDAASPSGQRVPAGTRVQADAIDENGDAVVFETSSDLWLSNFELKTVQKWVEGAAQPRNLGTRIVGVGSDPLRPLIRNERLTANERVFDQRETFYFGLHLEPGRSLEDNRPITLYFFLSDLAYDSTAPAPTVNSAPRVVWEYLTATNPQSRWLPLAVEDGTAGLTRSGAVNFLVPADFARVQRHLFELKMYWVRAYLLAPTGQGNTGSLTLRSENQSNTTYSSAPRLLSVALNTVAARHQVTVQDEILGSSSGNPGQTFQTFRRPILAGERLEVRESGAAGKQGVGGLTDWATWDEVLDFYGSGASDRHYVVDRLAGDIRFGDGQRGMIPPPGTRNVRMASYRSGGGPAGNVVAGSAKTLMAGGRFIQKVINHASASGGAPGETLESLLDRAPRALRHRFRAVTDEDYEDLAKLASTDVARALCVPLIDLAREPVKIISTMADEVAGTGKASVIIVPRSTSPKPLPSLALLRRVEQSLRENSSATASISVVGPLYLTVGVTADIKLASVTLLSRVERDLQRDLATWLHPLVGRGGAGWAFGREPHESDLYRLITENVAGVSHVINLTLEVEADVARAGWANSLPLEERLRKVRETRRFLICSGRHKLTFH